MNLSFWKNKNVFITGHTGFKGSWLSLWLQRLGSNITGYSLPPDSKPNLFELGRVSKNITSIFGDINEEDMLRNEINKSNAQIIFHLAAQPLVRKSYTQALKTFETNVLGTVKLLEAVKSNSNVKAIIIVTSDKCYLNKDKEWSYRESDNLGGNDPYSSSKACAEIVTHAYRKSFFNNSKVASVRSGNVIGGGDWSEDRLIPDIILALQNSKSINLRNPNSIRPWQHILEPIRGYMMLAEKLYLDEQEYASSWNFGPNEDDSKSTIWMTKKLLSFFEKDIKINIKKEDTLHEENYLSLNISKAKNNLGWYPMMNINKSLELVADWTKNYFNNLDMNKITLDQISKYEESLN